MLRVKGHILYNLNRFDLRVSGFDDDLKRLDTFYLWKGETYGSTIDFTGGDSNVLAKYEWLKDEFNWTLNKFHMLLSNLPQKEMLEKLRSGDTKKKNMRISEIVWKGTYWGPEAEIGHHC